MGTTSKTEDQMTEALLRNHLKQQPAPDSICREFDPDTANAYLERVLTESEISRYESHLSACGCCRKSIIRLAQLAEMEVPLTSVAASPAIVEAQAAAPEVEPGWVEKLKGWAGLLLTPRFALAAAAAIVLAVSFPLLLLRNYQYNQSTETASAKVSEPPSREQAQPATPPASALQDKGTATKTETTAQNGVSQQPAKPIADIARQEAQSQNGSAGSQPPPASANTTAATSQPAEAKQNEAPQTAPENHGVSEDANKGRQADEKPKEETADKVAANAPAAAAPAPPAPKKELEKIDPKDTMKSGEADKDTARVKTLKQGTPADVKSARNSEATIKPEDSNTQPPVQAPRKSLPNKKLGINSYRDGVGIPERSSSTPPRKIKDKYFWLIDDTWTDRDYRKERQLPETSLVKDSDAYKEVLSKHSGLQRYFSAFGENDKALVVYKDMVYILLPQKNK